MSTIWFDPDDDATELVQALRAEGYEVALAQEAFAGEDDLEDRSWRVDVVPFDDRVVAMVDVYGGWLAGDEGAPAGPVGGADLPDGPKRLKDR